MTPSPSAWPAAPKRPVRHVVLVAFAVVLLGAVIGAYYYLRDVLVPRALDLGAAAESTDHLREMASLLRDRAIDRGWPPLTGKRFVLSLVAEGLVDPQQPKALAVLFSPGDPDRGVHLVQRERWKRVTPEQLAGALDVDDLTSYAGPARPVGEAGASRVPVLADLNFEEWVPVAYSDGSAVRLGRAELGLGPDDPIVLGADSKSPILRQLSYE